MLKNTGLWIFRVAFFILFILETKLSLAHILAFNELKANIATSVFLASHFITSDVTKKSVIKTETFFSNQDVKIASSFDSCSYEDYL
jgi:hypothetical protein